MTEIQRHADTLAERQVITDFLEWLDEQKFEIAAWRPHGTMMVPILEDRSRLLDRFLRVDAAQLERERRALLRGTAVKP